MQKLNSFILILFYLIWIQYLAGSQLDLDVWKIGKRGQGSYNVWVYFLDKIQDDSPDINSQFLAIRDSMHDRTIQRREKVKSDDNLIGIVDLPVSNNYIQLIKKTGVKIRNKSKWLNAVSISGTREQIELITQYSFVKKIEPVLNGRRRKANPLDPISKTHSDSSYYGNSFNQLNQINIIQLHELGYSGKNVRVLVLDSGFYLNHEVFDSIDVIGAYDFVDQDSIVFNEQGKDPSNQHNHGTAVLSVIAGFKPDKLIGSAYGAEFILGKTEDLSIEAPIEEDNFIAGLEWGESLGADILSSSIGYIDWYTQHDLDGETAVISLAVNIAIENGMIAVTAVGNSGFDGIVAPADAFQIISCGAVDENGLIASFSSRGPTADGRIKPEVCAQGRGTFTATAFSTSSYGNGIGTSLSSPLVSGVCALLLEAHPDWTPSQVRNAIITTADQSGTPNNNYGWGIINAVAALNYNQAETPPDSAFFISNAYPNPSDGRVTFNLKNPPSLKLNLSIIDVIGASSLEKDITLSPDENILQLNLKDFSTGIYLAVFNFEHNKLITRKICHIKGFENTCTE